MTAPASTNHTSGHLLARNTLWNLTGMGTPLLAALFSIPVLVASLGAERFGILTLAWMVIGYFSLFDLGLGRALTKLVAEKLGAGQEHAIPPLVWAALSLMLVLGLIGALIVILISPWLTQSALKISPALQEETLRSFYLLALSIPVVINTAGLRGILEAQQRFDIVNALRIPMGVLTFLGPLLILPFSHSLVAITSVLVVSRMVAWLAHLLLCIKVMPTLRTNVSIRRQDIRPLLHLGGWMTVTNIVGPLMVYLDRFLIGSMVSMAAVAYYVTPYEVVTKFLLIPGALVAVLFPAFSASLVSNQRHAADLFQRGVKYTFLVLFPLILATITFAHEGLGLWLNSEFATHGTKVLQWLAVGVFLNSLANIPFAFIQSAGRPDITAKLHLIELPFYLLTIWWLLHTWGIVGAAIAWAARAAIDAIALFWLATHLMPGVGKRGALKLDMLAVIAALFVFAVGGMLTGLGIKIGFLVIALLTFTAATWFLFLSHQERLIINATLHGKMGSFK
ncbi:flippase [Sulfuriferula sp. GW1]|uniref:flippase n=1 Tax=Sulfuriferula sp. GW1 TaxID=3345111 RepID=UPI0039B0A8CB